MGSFEIVKSQRWKSSRTAVFNCGYHIIFCPKYRRKVLVGDIETMLKECLTHKALEHGWVIDTMEIMPDHVHLFIKVPPTAAPHYVVQQLKGYSAFQLRKQFPQLKLRMGTLWTRSYYVESVGHISEQTIQKYIEDQKQPKPRYSSHG